MAKVQVQVTTASLHVRSGAANSYRSVGIIKKGEKYSSSQQKNGWYFLDSKNGWSYGKSGIYLKPISDITAQVPPAVKVDPPLPAKADSKEESKGIDKKILEMLLDSVKKTSGKVDGSTRLFGAPFQFIEQTDFRISGKKYDMGRKYMESIMAESPIVFIMPGIPNFLPDVAKDQRKAFQSFFASQKTGKDDKSVLEKILKYEDVRYFDFLSDYTSYMKYVNLLCRTSAVYMGLGDETCPIDALRTKYKWFDWSNYRYVEQYKTKKEKTESIFDMAKETAGKLKDDMFNALFGTYQYTQFYVDPSTSFTESSTNQTKDSALAGLFQTGQDLMKEISFFANTGAMGAEEGWLKEQGSGFNSWVKSMNDGFMKRLLDSTSSIMTGSNIAFPEIWNNADYNKSYNITVNLISPYGDKESIYLNIIVPLMHLMALTLPRQTGANTFTNPFLVKVSSKGWFNCEMGIVDNISIEKVQGSWSVHGLPTEVRVQLSIKDLYSTLSMAPSNKPEYFYENKGLMNWLAVTSGLDITKPAFEEKWHAILMTLINSKADIPGNVYNEVIESVKGALEKIWRV